MNKLIVAIFSCFILKAAGFPSGAANCNVPGVDCMDSQAGNGGFETTFSNSTVAAGGTVTIQILSGDVSDIQGFNFWCENGANRYGTYESDSSIQINSNACAGPGETITQTTTFRGATVPALILTFTAPDSAVALTCKGMIVASNAQWWTLDDSFLTVEASTQTTSSSVSSSQTTAETTSSLPTSETTTSSLPTSETTSSEGTVTTSNSETTETSESTDTNPTTQDTDPTTQDTNPTTQDKNSITGETKETSESIDNTNPTTGKTTKDETKPTTKEDTTEDSTTKDPTTQKTTEANPTTTEEVKDSEESGASFIILSFGLIISAFLF